jgi:hypothetical protein
VAFCKLRKNHRFIGRHQSLKGRKKAILLWESIAGVLLLELEKRLCNAKWYALSF